MKASIRIRRYDLLPYRENTPLRGAFSCPGGADERAGRMRALRERSIEKLRGEIAHLALSFIRTPGNHEIEDVVDHAVRAALALSRPSLPLASGRLRRGLASTLKTALELGEARPFFQKGLSKIYTELEVLDESGEAHRLDRLVITEKGPVILEYKTGARQEAHKAQVQEYCELVRPVFGRTKGFLFYLDEPALVEVS